MEPLQENILFDIGHDQHKLIAAIANEHIGIAYASKHGVNDGLDGHIASMVSKRIVYDFEVVEVDEGNARKNSLMAQLVFEKTTTERPGKGIAVNDFFIDRIFFIGGHLFNANEHARIAIDVDEARRCLVGLFANAQNTRTLLAIIEHLGAYLAHAYALFKKEALRVLELLLVDEAHIGINLPQPGDLFESLGSCHTAMAVIRIHRNEFPSAGPTSNTARPRSQSAEAACSNLAVQKSECNIHADRQWRANLIFTQTTPHSKHGKHPRFP